MELTPDILVESHTRMWDLTKDNILPLERAAAAAELAEFFSEAVISAEKEHDAS